MLNRVVRLAQRPDGPLDDSVWNLCDEDIPTMGDGQVLVGVEYLSLDPAMRGWLNEGKSYIEPVAVGAVMRALGLGKVLASSNPRFKEGDLVGGMLGVQRYLVTDGRGLQKLDPNLAPAPKYLSALGMPGMTAYFGLLDIGQPQPGETLVVSAAAGAVGSVVGQIGKLKGCRVVGIAGGADKCRYVREELGFDEAIDYKSENLDEALKRNCPKGVDIYFDNVGGETLEAVLGRLAMKARIIICGAISQYNTRRDQIPGPRNYLALLVCRARMEGMVVMDYAARYPTAVAEIGAWMAGGQLRSREHIEVGIDRFPEVLGMLFDGRNFGKLILDVRED